MERYSFITRRSPAFGPCLSTTTNSAQPPARRLYCDTVCHGSQAALRCAWQAFGAEHVVTASDYPFLTDQESYTETFAYISRSDLRGEDIDQIIRLE